MLMIVQFIQSEVWKSTLFWKKNKDRNQAAHYSAKQNWIKSKKVIAGYIWNARLGVAKENSVVY